MESGNRIALDEAATRAKTALGVVTTVMDSIARELAAVKKVQRKIEIAQKKMSPVNRGYAMICGIEEELIRAVEKIEENFEKARAERVALVATGIRLETMRMEK